MVNKNCPYCDHKKNAPNGICSRFKASDGLSVRCTGPWGLIKHRVVRDYCDILTVSMGKRNKFKEINYIELFSGPGIYLNRESGTEEKGSPLIAADHDFDKLYLNDLNTDSLSALRKRIHDFSGEISYTNKDANAIGKIVNENISKRSISFCFLDPDNMGDLNFQTVNSITEGKRVDLLINFPYMDYKRSVHSTEEKFTRFFGTDEWKVIEENHRNEKLLFRGNELTKLYMKQLSKIGYVYPSEGQKNIIPIYNTRNGLLYYLLFACKDKLGYKFCNDLTKYSISQQEFNF